MAIESKIELKPTDKIIFGSGICIVSGILFTLLLFLLGVGHSIPLKFTSQYLKWIFLEIGISVFASIVILMMLKRWLERKNSLTRNLLWLCIMYTSSIASNIYTKIIKYIIDVQVYAPDTYLYGLIYNFRFTSLFSGLAGFLFYAFYIEVFVQKEKTTRSKKWIIIYSLIASFCQLLPLFADRTHQILIMALMLIQAFIIYIPVAVNAYKIVRRTSWEKSEVQIFYGFLFLFILAVSFICIWLSYVLSIISDIITSQNYGAFYIIMQIFTISMLIMVYLGFIMPNWFKRYLDKRQKVYNE